MNKRRLSFYLAIVIAVMQGVGQISRAQGTQTGVVANAKTKGGTVTYFVAPRQGYNIDIFAKEAGEPSDFGTVLQRCTTAKQQVVFAMNGAKCDKSLKPLGLLIKGLTKHINFAWPDKNVFSPVDPSGVFAIDRSNGVHIIPAKEFKPNDDLATYQLAIQSGPMLIIRSFLNPSVTRATNTGLWSGIGVRANGDVILAVANDKISLREFAVFFQDNNCTFALVLDEGERSQWYAPGKPKKPGRSGEIIVVAKK